MAIRGGLVLGADESENINFRENFKLCVVKI